MTTCILVVNSPNSFTSRKFNLYSETCVQEKMHLARRKVGLNEVAVHNCKTVQIE